MEKRRLAGYLSGTAATGAGEVEVAAAIDVEVGDGVTRVRLAPAARPEAATVEESTHPAVVQWVARLQHQAEMQARAEAHRNAPCTPRWKPKRTRREERPAMVCPDCEGLGEMAGARCVACNGQGWRQG